MRSSSAAARQRCRPEITISEGKWGAILELLAATTRVFNITDEEALEVVVNETDKLARIYELDRYKMADTVSLSVSERSFKKWDPSLWTSPEKFVVLGDQT